VAALAGSLYGAEIQAITPQDFMWSASLELLLLVVFGGRALIFGAVIAGAVYILPSLPQIPTKIDELIPLLVAIGVIGLAQEPEGTVALARLQTRHVLGVLRPLPHRPAAAPGLGGSAPVGAPKVVTSHVR
jgi:branched-subunit amino acid ABC-type transport system permease component